MANDWPQKTVIELQRAGCLLVEDGNHGEYRPRPNEFGSGEWAFIRAADMDNGQIHFDTAERINETARDRIIKGIGAGGDVILSHKGTVGKVALAPLDAPPFVCSPQTTFWRTRNPDCLDRRYLYYYLCFEDFQQQLNARKGETDMADYVSLTAQRVLKVTVPPIEIQRAIARTLGALDDKIELIRRMNRTLEAMAAALFKSWFVDFDPVTAKAEGRAPYGMKAETAALFPSAFQDLEMGSIPHRWRVGALSEIADINARVRKADYAHKIIEYIDISSVNAGQLTGRTSIEIDDAPSRAQRLVSHGDTIWSCVRPNRKSYLFIQHPKSNVVVSTGFAVLSPKISSSAYLYLWVTTDDFVEYLTAHAEGSAYPAVRPDSFEMARVLIPPHDVLAAFEKRVGTLFKMRHINECQSHTLIAIRDALLPKLLSGEIRVKQVEKIVTAT